MPRLFKLNLIKFIDSFTHKIVNFIKIFSKLLNFKLGFSSIIFLAITLIFSPGYKSVLVVGKISLCKISRALKYTDLVK